MAIDVTSLAIKVTSDGILEASNALKALATSASGAQTATKSFSESQQASANSTEAMFAKMQKQADLLGANTSETFAYTAAMKGATDLEQQMAAMLGAEVDAYKALGDSQKNAIKDDQELADSYRKLAASADAYYAAQAKAQASGNELNIKGQIAQQYAKIVDAQRELIRTTKELEAAEAKLNKDHGAALEMEKARNVRALSAAQSEAIGINNQMIKAEKDAKDAGDAFIANLKAQTATLGMTAQQVKDYNIAQMELKAQSLGVSGAAAPMIQSLKDTAVHAGSAHSGMAGITRELIVLTHEMSQGQFSRFGGSMLVMAEKINFVPTVAKAASSAIESLGLGLAGFAGVIILATELVAAFTLSMIAMFQGAKDFHQMNSALILTGNYAGTTATGLLEMAHAATAAGGSMGEAKKTVIELANSGKFTKDQIGLITEAVIALEHGAGVPIENTIKQFDALAAEVDSTTIRSTHAISKHAQELNDHYHYMNAATLERIRVMENEGDAHGALAFSIERYAKNAIERAHEVEADLSAGIRTLHKWADEVRNVWAAIADGENRATKKANLKAELLELEPTGPDSSYTRSLAAAQRREKLQKEIFALDETEKAKAAAADAQGKASELEKQRGHDQAFLEQLHRSKDKKYAAKIEESQAEAAWQRQTNEYKVSHQVEHDQLMAALAKAQVDKVAKVRSEGMTGIDAVLKGLEAESQAVQTAYDNQLKVIEHVHKTGAISDKVYADAKASTLERQMENTAAYYDKEIAALQSFNGKSVNENNLASSKIAELTKKKEKALADYRFGVQMTAMVESDAAQATLKLEQDKADKVIVSIQKQTQELKFQNAAYDALPDAIRKAGISAKQMQDAITQQRINALEAEKANLEASVQGADEAAKQRLKIVTAEINAEKGLKDAQTIREAQQEEAKKNAAITAHEKSLSLAHAMEKAYTDAFKGMEDALVSFAKTGKLDFASLADSIISDLIRIQIRAAMGSADGGGSGLFGLVGAGLSSLMGGGLTVDTSVAGAAGGITSDTVLPMSLRGGMADGGFAAMGTGGLVNERGPELYTSGGKDYLLTNGTSGTITPHEKLGDNSTNVTFAPVINIDSRTDRAEVQQLVQNAVSAGNAKLVDTLSRNRRI